MDACALVPVLAVMAAAQAPLALPLAHAHALASFLPSLQLVRQNCQYLHRLESHDHLNHHYDHHDLQSPHCEGSLVSLKGHL